MPYITSYEQFGIEKGISRGERLLVQKLLEGKFGTLSPSAQMKLKEWPQDRLLELVDAVYKGQSLSEMGLE